jgi:hypothetical protein
MGVARMAREGLNAARQFSSTCRCLMPLMKPERARQIITQETPPNAGDAAGVLQVVVDDRIASGFYVTCDPAERPTLVTAHLAGIDGPELLAQDGWDIDARLYKGRDSFGAAVVSASAMVYTPAP